MPRGLAKIQGIAKENAAKRAAYDAQGPGIPRLRIADGETVKVRFLEQGDEVEAPWTHRLPKLPGQNFGDTVLCLDPDDLGTAPCPGCELQKGRSARICINVIWFDAPKLVRDKEGKPVKDGNGKWQFNGTEDIIAIWERGPSEAGRLSMLDEEHGGLTTGICKIRRTGSTKDDTTYHIDWVESKAPSPSEVELYKKKGDPKKILKSMSYGDMRRAYSGGGQATSDSTGEAPPAGEGNAFAAATQGAASRGAFGSAPEPEPAPVKSGVKPNAFT